MSGTTHIEYHTSCPSCGAVNNGKEICDFCGASLIKSREVYSGSVGEQILDQEQANELEDSMYPVIHGKSGNLNSFLVLFCSIFGGMFVAIPTVLFVAFVSTGIAEGWMVLFFGLFWVIGIGALIPLFLNISNHSKCRRGQEITGTVRGYEESMVTVNGRPVLNVRLLIYGGAQPQLLILNTGSSRRQYPLGKTIRLKNYKDCYMIAE